MKHLRKLLFPFSALYYGGIWVRNFCYDKGLFSSNSYDFPVICVGNLSTGGTGKTPMTEYLIRLLKDKTSLGVLSRGYGRKTRGFMMVEDTHSAIKVGDEPLQYASKFNDVQVAVCEDRSTGIKKLRDEVMPPDAIVLDDAFQHRKVTAGFSVLLSAYQELFYKDYLLPAGNLRDLRVQARRAQAIVITKCPISISLQEKTLIHQKVERYSKSPVYFASIAYSEMVFNRDNKVALSSLKNKELTVVTGIANPQPLVHFLKSKNMSFEHKRYPDHYHFRDSDIYKLQQCSCILTTEKDYMRLQSRVAHRDIYYIPIETTFLDNDSDRFDKAILDFVLP